MFRTHASPQRRRVSIEHRYEGERGTHSSARFFAFRRWCPLRSTFVKPRRFQLITFSRLRDS
jgi:hypothetical protein